MDRKAPDLSTLKKVTFCGVTRPMSPLTKEEMRKAGFKSCQRPPNYIEDENNWMRDTAMFLKTNHLVCGGVAGTGKDDFIVAYCATFNLPLEIFAFKQGSNPVDSIMRTTLVGDGKGGTLTKEVEGRLLAACRGVKIKRDFTKAPEEMVNSVISEMKNAGYSVKNRGGMLTITIPSVVCFSDYDRAPPEFTEVLRQALELGKESLPNPVTGGMELVLPNTRFFLTANSGADGDGGRGNLTQMKDSSLLSRCISIYVPPPTKEFEQKVVQAEFPTFSKKQGALLVDCIRAVRKVSQEVNMGLEITLRQAKQWGHACMTVMQDLEITDFKEGLRKSFCVISGHLHEEENRNSLEGAIDPFIKSAVVEAEEDLIKRPIDKCPID